MKTYNNGKKATEFSKKQIGVIYGKAKNGELKIEKWVITDLYDMAEYYGFDDNGSAAQAEAKIQKILEAVFEGNTEEAQKRIDNYTSETFNLLGIKAQQRADRSLLA